MMCNEGKRSNLLDGLMLGGLLGAALGILFAPVAGDETRQKIKTKLKEMELDEIVDKIGEAFEAGKDEMEKVAKETEE